MKIGSALHRDAFCGDFVATHQPWEPETLPWPVVDGAALALLRAMPFWTYARAIEQRAGIMVSAFAQTLDDPWIREAVALQGYEETRHGRLMQEVFERYGIPAERKTIAPEPPTRASFVAFGFGECTDSFIGFGAFAIAREKRLVPDALLQIFDDVLFEEARHITFFVNWFRYEEARAGRDRFGERHWKALSTMVRSAKAAADGSQALIDRASANVSYDFRTLLADVTPVHAVEAALAEQERHFGRLDPRLPKPGVMRTIAHLALAGLRALPPRPRQAIVSEAPATSSCAKSASPATAASAVVGTFASAPPA